MLVQFAAITTIIIKEEDEKKKKKNRRRKRKHEQREGKRKKMQKEKGRNTRNNNNNKNFKTLQSSQSSQWQATIMSFCTVPTVHASVMADMILTKVPSAHGRFQSESVQTWCSKRYSIHGQFTLASKGANGVLHFHFYVCFCVYCVASVDKHLSSWVLFINLLFEWSQHSSCGRRCGKVDRNKVFAVVRLVLQNHHLSQLLSSKVENHWNKSWRFPILQKLCSSKGFPKVRKSAFGKLEN